MALDFGSAIGDFAARRIKVAARLRVRDWLMVERPMLPVPMR
jgi:hypothetical protein